MLKNFKNKTFLLLLITVLVGFFLRIYRISENTLYGDELTLVYDSYSLLKTGHDQVGKFLPLTFTMGAGRPAGYVYGSIPFVALFGPTVQGARMLSILSGVGLVVLMYFLSKKLFNKDVGLVAAFITCVSPWSMSLSRAGFEANFALFLAVLGVVAFLYAKDKPKLYLVSALSWGLVLNTYPTYKLILPLLLIFLVSLSGGVKTLFFDNKYIKFALVIGIFLSLVAYSQSFLSNSEQRFLSINVFSQSEINARVVEEINSDRNFDQLGGKVSIIFHNKVEKYFTLLRDEYLKNLSVNFLFLKGDGNPRHNASVTGEFYFVEILLIFLGFVYLIKNNDKNLRLLLFWVLTVPFAGVPLLQEHALRNSFMLPPLLVLSALGFVYILKKKNYLLITTVILVWLIQFAFIAERIYFLSPNLFARFWSYPAYQAASIAIDNQEKYDYIFLSDKIDNVEYAYPIYGKVDPNLVISQNIKRETLNNLNFKKLGKVYVGSVPSDIDSFANNLKGNKLFILDYSEIKSSGEVVDSKDGSHSLFIKSFK